MSPVAVIAGLSGMVQGLCGLTGSLLFYLCLNHPKTVLLWAPAFHDRNSTNSSFTHLQRLHIMTGLATDPDRDTVFCFSISCGLFNLIWCLSSLVLLLGCRAVRNPRLYWQWVLTTISLLLLHFLGGIYFAVKTARHVIYFDVEKSEAMRLNKGTQEFLQYGYPFLLLAVFSGGMFTWPVNVLLSFLVKKKAEEHYLSQDKGALVEVNGSCNMKQVADKVNAESSRDAAVYTNQSFCPDEKY